MSPEPSQGPRCYSYIRFSSPDQLKGNSLSRQLKLSEQYAKEHGLIIDTSLKPDMGLSAYSGDHVKNGTFGDFLQLVEKGRIPTGSILLVESLDRLSREEPMDALAQFNKIIKHGIKIVTLGDNNRVYSEESIKENSMNLLGSIMLMIRAHEESETKSKRLSAAWENKRLNASLIPVTGRTPAWLRLNKKLMLIEPIQERVVTIKEIFQKSSEGIGIFSITRELNEKGIRSWGKSKGWHLSYVAKILHNRAVIGEFQPYKIQKLDRKKTKIPVGEPIKNYFPAVISEDQFYQAQEQLKANINQGGKNGKISNLFSYLAKCGYCGSSMSYVNKGNTSPQKGKYLVCDAARRDMECKYVSFPYPEFEEAMLRLCNEIEIEDLIVDEDKERFNEIKSYKNKFLSIEGRLSVINRKITSMNLQADMAEDKEQIGDIVTRRTQAYREREDLRKEKKKIQTKINSLENQEAINKNYIEAVKGILEKLQTETGDGLIQLRHKLRGAIRELVREIIVFPEGMGGKIISYENLKPEYTDIQDINKNYIGSLNAFLGGADEELQYSDIESAKRQIKEMQKENETYPLLNTDKDKRAFHVFFKSGAFKEIQYDPMVGYGVLSEINDQNFRIGNEFQIMGNFLKQDDSDKPSADFEKNMLDLIKQPIQTEAKPAIFDKVLYNPHPGRRQIEELASRIVNLRDSGATWKEIKLTLENEKIKSPTGQQKWYLSTLSRIYDRTKINK